MAGQPETPVYDSQVYQWEVTDPVQGGTGGVANLPLLNLADRTAWLKQRLDSLIAGTLIPPTVAPLNGPAFTGSVTAPNVRPGDDSTLIANTNFVQTRDHGTVYVTVSGGNMVLTQDQYGVGIIILVGTLTSQQGVFFPVRGKWVVWNATSGGFPLYCASTGGGTLFPIPQGFSCAIFCDSLSIVRQDTALIGRGEVGSPNLAPTGVGPGIYSMANIQVGADGRIVAASGGNPTFAQIIAGLGFTPVQQGGGAFQGSNKIYFGWNATDGRMRVQIDGLDGGEVPFMNEFIIGSSAAQNVVLTLPTVNSTKVYLMMGSVAASHTGSGVPETTLCPLNTAFPHSFIAATGSYLGFTPPSTSSPAFQPYTNTTIAVTTNFSVAQAALGCVYFAIGT